MTAFFISDPALTVGNSTFKFLQDHRRFVKNRYVSVRIGVRFAHLLLRIGKAHDSSANFRNIRLRDLEGLAISIIEPYCNISGKLNMLLLIVSNRNQIRLVKQNIASHKHRISKQTCINIVSMLCTLILKLGHAVKLTHIGIACKYPIELRMLHNIALNKQWRYFGVYAASNKQSCHAHRALTKLVCILPYGQSMHICHAIIAEFVIILHELPIS